MAETMVGKAKVNANAKAKGKEGKKAAAAPTTRMTMMTPVREPVLPSREGLDEDYYYDIGAM